MPKAPIYINKHKNTFWGEGVVSQLEGGGSVKILLIIRYTKLFFENIASLNAQVY